MTTAADAEDKSIGNRLRDSREALGLSRVIVAQRLSFDSARLANYELGRVSMPYHSGARLAEFLNANQRWLVTGNGLPMPYFPVLPVIEDTVPRSMPFREFYSRFLGGLIEERFQIIRNHLGRELSASDVPTFALPPVGCANELVELSFTLDSVRAKVADLGLDLDIKNLRRFGADLDKLVARYKKTKESAYDDFSIAERSMIAETPLILELENSLLDWKPPGHARRER